ncbi:adult-specific cuticular protein ACP-20 [Halyomorpha halys]|uniref:adult-specific cuticular protein ACP-20 n=1 Tax=Halyomorpha halys TaxID=286706 RepID=UPI0006D503BE|nr:adult-specific cuticular protein ACP-20-like [Halyomorpha halys]
MYKALVLLSLVYAASAIGGYGGGHGGHEDHIDYYAPPHYNFEYSVHDPHTHDVKSQHETREGDVVKGYYSLKEADGTERIVHYTADHHNGFNAVVERKGHAVHPHVVHHGHHY